MRTEKERVAAVIPTHPARSLPTRNAPMGLLARAVASVGLQRYPVDHISIAMDTDQEGAPGTRQRALEQSDPQCAWVAFLDSDDMWGAHHVETLLNHALEHDLDFAYSWFQVILPDGRIVDDPVFPATHRTNPFDPDNPIETTITTLVKRDLALQVGFKPLDRGEVNSGEDRRFTLECLKAGARIGHVPDVTTWLWSHEGQNTSGLSTKGDARAQ